MGEDAMRYDFRFPDPVTVAAYIAKFYRIKSDTHGDKLVGLFNDSVEIGKKG